MKNSIFSLALTALCFAATTVMSQTPLQPGQNVAGQAEIGMPACYLLITQPNTAWQITADGGNHHTTLEVGRGSCQEFVADRTGGYSFARAVLGSYASRVEFGSGGGAYLVRVTVLSGAVSPFQLRAQQVGSTSRNLLPAGAVLGPWLQPNWTPASVSVEPARAGEGLRPGSIFKDCADVCPEMVVIPAGSFTMGSPAEEADRDASEGPRHPVALVNAFAIGRYEVTFAEYDACVADGGCTHNPNDQGWGRARRPVVDVSWNDAQAYVSWLSIKTGQRYSLPSESEWEYAARAGANTRWQTGNAILTDDANILNTFARTVPVGSYPPNAFGLHDVHGNVSEWTLDCLDTGYLGVPNDGSAATSGNCAGQRLNRGGNYSSEPSGVRFAFRGRAPQTTRLGRLGFRVARAL